MAELERLKRELAERLSARLGDVTFSVDESEREACEPLEKPLCCISVNRVELREAAIGNYVGLPEGGYGRRADVTLGFSIFCREGAGRCGEVFAALCDALLFDGEASLREISCGAASYLARREVFRLDALARCGMLLVQGGGDDTVEGFRLQVR